MKQFIVIDGPDGVGKTTLAKRVVEQLRAHGGFKVVYTSEPTESPLGREIRRHLAQGDIEPMALLDLFLLDRTEHLHDFVVPAIEDGVIVVCDRYKYSTTCYQHLHGVPLDTLLSLDEFLAPDVVFLPYLCPEQILRRMAERGKAPDLFESRLFIQRACEMFRRMPDFYPAEKFVQLDATSEINELSSLVLEEVLK